MNPRLRDLDIGMLRALQALLNTAGVSAAALRIGVEQPAMSRRLAALRRMTGDQLLVRVGSEMHLTPHARSLRPIVDRVLSDLALLAPPEDFDPALIQRQFTLASYDFLPPELLAGIVSALLAQSPASSLVLQGIGDKADFVRRMCEGEIDAAITSRMDIPGVLRSCRLISEPLAVLVRRGHPLAGGVDLHEYARSRHISALEHVRGAGAAADALLAAAGIRHTVVFRTQYLSMVPALVAQTDLVFTTGLRHARQMAAEHQLASALMPASVGVISSHLVWHERTHLDPAAQWLRELLIPRIRAL